MGYIRFRRSFGAGPFRINLGKKGVSMTAGRRRGGPHFTLHSSGRTTVSAGLPGTGLSYVSTSKVGRITRAAKAARGKLYWIICALIFVGLVVGSQLWS
jgi:hypothetical protein